VRIVNLNHYKTLFNLLLIMHKKALDNMPRA
jgi:hypothetical protein